MVHAWAVDEAKQLRLPPGVKTTCYGSEGQEPFLVRGQERHCIVKGQGGMKDQHQLTLKTSSATEARRDPLPLQGLAFSPVRC